MSKITVHGHTINYESEAHSGISYLMNNLDYEEAKVIFQQAKTHGHAAFEDHQNREYTLEYHGGTYTLSRR